MKFTTQVPVKAIVDPITYNDKIMAIGSCFAVNISEKLRQYQFQVNTNAFGILFHPLAIEKMLSFANENKTFTQEDIFCHNEIWSSLHAHSDLNQLDPEDLVDLLNARTSGLRKNLKESSYCIITLGTAWVYRFLESDEIVANCHKLPNKEFKKELLSAQQILSSLKEIINLVRKHNKQMHIIFTLSPVRHIKDGFVENQNSKALLHCAIQKVVGLDQQGLLSYFPAYEIMMDELRDYRFYNADLIHPNQIAIDFIWQRFLQGYIDQDMYEVMKKVDQVQKGLNHVPFNPRASAHLEFLDTLIQKIDDLLDQYPFMNFR